MGSVVLQLLLNHSSQRPQSDSECYYKLQLITIWKKMKFIKTLPQNLITTEERKGCLLWTSLERNSKSHICESLLHFPNSHFLSENLFCGMHHFATIYFSQTEQNLTPFYILYIIPRDYVFLTSLFWFSNFCQWETKNELKT